jgi:hypothetical protein
MNAKSFSVLEIAIFAIPFVLSVKDFAFIRPSTV